MIIRTSRWMAVLLLMAAVAPGWSQPSSHGPPSLLTNAQQVISIPRELADSRLPVSLEGVVTCYVPSSELCFVQDDSGGIYVLPSPWPRELVPGQVVRVQGYSGAGLFSPIVHLGSVEPTGGTQELKPLPISLEDLNTGQYDSQSIVVEAVVREQNRRYDHTELILANGTSRAVGLIFGPQDEDLDLVDARVKLTGVAGTFYHEGRLTGFGILLHDWTFAEVLTPALSDPFAAPLRPAYNLAWYAPEGGLEHRIRLRGTVTMARTNLIFMQSDGVPVRVNVTKGDAAAKPGDVVEALGFIHDPTGQPQLDQALCRVITGGPIPEPLALQPDERLEERFRNHFVTVTAQVLRQAAAPAGARLAVERNGQFFTVHLPRGTEAPRAGSRVRLSGVWVPAGAAGALPGEGLWVHSPAGAAVLARPTEPDEPSNLLPVAAAGLSTLAAVALLGGLIKARRETGRVRKNREMLEEQAAESERQLQSSLAVRERLAQDLHDHIIQSIYALGLKVDDCTQQIQKDPEQAQQRLQSVPSEVNAVIRDLRNVILGIETNAIHPQEFKTALKSLALTLSQDQPGKIRIDVEQSAVDALTQEQATELIHLAREAVSNSLRHANAQTTTLRLHRLNGNLQFAIEDDGKGFDAGQTAQKGFGLRNMARRAENLRARFEVKSEPGQGTIIMLDIPRQKQHF